MNDSIFLLYRECPFIVLSERPQALTFLQKDLLGLRVHLASLPNREQSVPHLFITATVVNNVATFEVISDTSIYLAKDHWQDGLV